MKRLAFLSALFLLVIGVQAQDYMTLRDGKTLEVKILELGVDEIKYKTWPAGLDQPILAIDKIKVAKVRMENGEIIEFSGDNFTDKDMYLGQKKNAAKINFLSPLNGSLWLGYERSVKPGQSFEVELGIIGAGFDVAEQNPRGVGLKGGYKFIKTPDFYMKGMRYSHILKGGYIKPELIITNYSADVYVYDPNTWEESLERVNTTGGAVMINLGKQWIYSDVFLLDLYFGIGYGFSSDRDVNQYGFVGGNSDVPIAFSAGMKIGGLF
jgi:hypothetical protein